MDKKLYAIYKNGYFKGNERGVSKLNAIEKYIIASSLEDFLNDKGFMSQYFSTIAVQGWHYE